MSATVFFLSRPNTSNVEMEAYTPKEKLSRMVKEFAINGASMTVREMESKLDQWRHDPATLLDLPEDARSQMLANMDNSVSSLTSKSTVSLASDVSLCAKKDVILAKFDALLKRLVGEELALNISHDKVDAEFKAAQEAWLDSESEYRLTIAREEEAKEGATYAQQQYEKYDTAFTAAGTAHDTMARESAEELAALQGEFELIKDIMRTIGVLQDNATSAAAEAFVPPPTLKAKIDALRHMALKTKTGGSMLAALGTKLAGFTEANEVATILKQMLQDISERMRVLRGMAAQSGATVDTLHEKLIEWQTKLVDLSDAKDKARAAAQAADLERQALAGTKKVAHATALNEHSAYKLTITPYLKEIDVIQLVKRKITDRCA